MRWTAAATPLAILWITGSSAFGQLTLFQKQTDFQQLVALYNKQYALYDWKVSALQYDGLNLAPWNARVDKSASDLEFMEICAEYVAAYRDSHSSFYVPSYYEAFLGFTVDIYSGKVLVDSIQKSNAPPVQIGDEIVAVDGKSAEESIAYFSQFHGEGNAVSARRFGASQIPYRVQSVLPRAHEIGDTASVTVRNSAGQLNTYAIPWVKLGEPFVFAGPVQNPGMQNKAALGSPWEALKAEYDSFRLPTRIDAFNLGQLQPLFTMPAGFDRTGVLNSSVFAGTFPAGKYKIGFLRIPSFDSVGGSVAKELKALAGTDALIIDVMRNPGGSGCEAETIAGMFFSEPFHSIGVQFRATWHDMLGLQDSLIYANTYGSSDVSNIQNYLDAFRAAYAKPRGLTQPIGVCQFNADTVPPTAGVVTYTKPVLLLTDEFSASAADLFAAILQDNARDLQYGKRTNGAGGSVVTQMVGFYMEAFASVTRSIAVRNANVVTSDYPAAPYIENVGVRPDVEAEFMTEENLRQKGKPFADELVRAFVAYLDGR